MLSQFKCIYNLNALINLIFQFEERESKKKKKKV